ncbi:MAG: alpha/beta fold hydrolase [Gammaproteobacteria bacterium]|nr:alpha/beta fold hydrolase [Gammaproteobacteria bacterium]
MQNIQTIKIAGQPQIAVDVAGAGPLLIMMHGIGGNKTNWRAQVSAFSEFLTAVAWDARGYGESDDYAGPLNFADFSQDLLRIMDHFGARKAHIMGLSMGGRISLDFYARYPERVATLTLCDTSAGSKKVASAEEVDKFLALRKQPLLDGKTPADIAPDVAKSLAGVSVTPDKFQLLVDSLAELHAESYMKTLDCVTRYTSFPEFNTITVPTLCVVGEEDRIALPEYVKHMADNIPGAIFRELPKAGHVSNVERPELFNAAVLPFLQQHRTLAI